MMRNGEGKNSDMTGKFKGGYWVWEGSKKEKRGCRSSGETIKTNFVSKNVIMKRNICNLIKKSK